MNDPFNQTFEEMYPQYREWAWRNFWNIPKGKYPYPDTYPNHPDD